MNRSSSKIIEYYANGHYKGFYPKQGERHYKTLGREVHLSFTNGEKEFVTAGASREQALSKIFDRIDKYFAKSRMPVKNRAHT